jgi:endonuclease-3
MTLKERYDFVLDRFRADMPAAQSELHYADAYQLIVAVILSAQCTDKRVNMTTPALFERFPAAAALAAAEAEEIYPYIKSISYPNNKARNLSAMARMLVNEMHGVLPRDPREMERLPGVGRKTANVLAAVLFDEPVMPVDTHVFRVANRIGLTRGKTPRMVEDQLTAHIPAALLPRAHHWLILHGRYVCTARAPRCAECGIRPACRWVEKKSK